MNDLESRLRSLTFREPPPGWRGSMVSAATVERGWRTWLAPHPAAWAALAAIWIMLALISRTYDQPGTGSSSLASENPALSDPALLASYFRSANSHASD